MIECYYYVWCVVGLKKRFGVARKKLHFVFNIGRLGELLVYIQIVCSARSGSEFYE